MKRAVSTYMIQWMRLKLPASALITVYEMTPNIMPSEIEYVNGIAAMARNAGTASPASRQSMSAQEESIM